VSAAGPKRTVYGVLFPNRGDAHAVDYALLNVTEEFPRVGLTLSVGPWWDETEPSQRSWVDIDIRAEGDKNQLAIRNPRESNFYPWAKGGAPLSPEQAGTSTAIEEIRSVAKYIVETDVAVSSYLSGAADNLAGRERRAADQSQRSC
jgi:hypothetical protein